MTADCNPAGGAGCSLRADYHRLPQTRLRFQIYYCKQTLENMEVEIHIESEFPVPYKTTDLKINLENLESIGDMKKKLQTLLSVAACDMSVYHKTQVLSRKLENREKISNLYVREGDTFIVKFISVCNLHFFSKFLDDMRAFVKDVCETFSEGDKIKECIDWNDDTASAIDNCYRTVLHSLQECAHHQFVPWNCRSTIANRHYFAQEGGLELLARIYNFASKKRYPLGVRYVAGCLQECTPPPPPLPHCNLAQQHFPFKY